MSYVIDFIMNCNRFHKEIVQHERIHGLPFLCIDSNECPLYSPPRFGQAIPKKIENESQERSMNQEILHVEELESRLEMETAAGESDGSCGIKCTCTIEL